MVVLHTETRMPVCNEKIPLVDILAREFGIWNRKGEPTAPRCPLKIDDPQSAKLSVTAHKDQAVTHVPPEAAGGGFHIFPQNLYSNLHKLCLMPPPPPPLEGEIGGVAKSCPQIPLLDAVTSNRIVGKSPLHPLRTQADKLQLAGAFFLGFSRVFSSSAKRSVPQWICPISVGQGLEGDLGLP